MKENFFQEFRTKTLKLSFSEDKIKCPKCPREFSKTKYRNAHLKKCDITYQCQEYSKKFSQNLFCKDIGNRIMKIKRNNAKGVVKTLTG